jgi:hypothetical protein
MRPLPRGILVLALLFATLAVPSGTPARAAAPDLSAYQGIGAWVDLYDPQLLSDPEGTVARIAARGTRTLFLETSNYSMPDAVMWPEVLGRFLEAAHGRGMKVVAWYVPGFTDLGLDLHRSLAAIRFRSSHGHRFDSFGMDIESTRVPYYWERSRRAVELSKRVRAAVGPDYALGAIVLPPPLLDYSPSYWPGFPFKELGRIYDVFLPMGYWTFRYDGERSAYEFTRASIEGIRRRTARPAVPIHPIGGIADAVGPSEMRGFVHAVREFGVLGASMYDVGTSDRADWDALSEVAPTPPQNPPSPLTLGKRFGAYGNLPAGDTAHPREVVFRVGRRSGAWELDYELFALGQAEVSVLVNWKRVATLAPGTIAWGPRRTLPLPAGTLNRARNTITFTTGPANPPWPTWGVRNVSLVPGPRAVTDRAAHGYVPGYETTFADRVTYRLPASRGLVTITAQGFDVSAGEVLIQLDGNPVGHLAPTGPRQWGLGQTFVLPLDALGPGTHRLTFDAIGTPPVPSVWAVRLVNVSGMTLIPGF